MANDRRRRAPNDRPRWFQTAPASGVTADWRDNPIEIQRSALDEGRATEPVLTCFASADLSSLCRGNAIEPGTLRDPIVA